MSDPGGALNVKQCCAGFYGSELAPLLLGESFHPGGRLLTTRLGNLVQLNRNSKVLDVAAGRGASALYIAETFECDLVGLDLSEMNVKIASDAAANRGLTSRVKFQIADAEELPFADRCFDAIVCECAFCTFPDKRRAAKEFYRVLKPGGRVGFSDVTRTTEQGPALDSLLSWIACIGDAQPVGGYVEIFQDAGLCVKQVENHDESLIELIRQIQGRLLIAEVSTALKKLPLPRIDFAEAKHLVQTALAAITRRQLGYALIIAVKT